MFRPADFGGSFTVEATLRETNGFAGVARRYERSLSIHSDGSIGSGYGLQFVRSGADTFNSGVTLFDGSTALSTINAPFQFGPQIDTNFTFSLDGSVSGYVSQGAERFNFSFGPRSVQSSGTNFLYSTTAADTRTGSFIFPRVDDLRLTSTPPSPRLFTLAIGASDGQGVRGDLDAQRVQSVLSQHPTFASTALGNTSSALSLTDDTPNVQLQIETALNSMQVSSTDTFVFYFSGHGGTLPTFSLGDAPETPVTLDGQPNTDDEYLAAGSFILTDDYLAALFDDPKWDGVRKIFLLDACFSGGFLGDGLTEDLGDLEQLDNFALFAAADEDALSYSLPLSGRGVWTELALLPTLRARVGFAELRDAIEDAGHSILDTFGGDNLFLRGINPPGSTGTFNAFSPLSVASADFSGSDPLLPDPVPEPSSTVMLIVGIGFCLRRQTLRRHEQSA